MPVSSTVIIALRYNGGVLIGSDSQATDPVAGVRWATTKLTQAGHHPLVIGHSGSVGSAQRVNAGIQELDLRANTFQRRARIQAALDRVMVKEREDIAQRDYPPPGANLPPIALWSLVAGWVEGAPRIIEYEVNGESSWHDNFHAIGSGAATAYAVYRTLGGSNICDSRERTAITAALRILRTVIDVDPGGVSEPYDLWRIRASGASRLGFAEVNTHLQYVEEWLDREQQALADLDRTAVPDDA